jgi:hypothetical protein
MENQNNERSIGVHEDDVEILTENAISQLLQEDDV